MSNTTLVVTGATMTATSAAERATGLHGFVSFVLNGKLRVDGATLRRTLAGRLTISFPARRDSAGRQHPFIHAIDDATRRDLERQILEALAIDEEAAR